MIETSARVIVAVASIAAVGLGSPAQADPPARSGVSVIREYTDVQKTPKGPAVRRVRIEYDWDRGKTLEHTFDAAGTLVRTRVRAAAPSPNAAEVASALALVDADGEVAEIRRRQAGIGIDGGFGYHATKGACAAPARCVQVFLFDGDNVVRHMLVDLRTSKIVERDHIPPQNRGAAQ